MRYIALALKVVLVVVLFWWVAIVQAQPGSAVAQNKICDNLNSYPSIVVPGGQPQAYYYCEKSGSTPSDVSIHLKNASSLMIIVKGINPLVRSFTVTTAGTPVPEVGGSALMTLLGIPSPNGQASAPPQGAQTPKLGHAGQGAPEFPACPAYQVTYDAVITLQRQASALATLADTYQYNVNKAQTTYLEAINDFENDVSPDGSRPSQDDFLNQSKTLDLASVQALSTVPVVAADDPTLSSFAGKSYSDVATSISANALLLAPTVKAPDSCAADVTTKTQVTADQSFLATLSSPAGKADSKMDQLITEVNGVAAAAVPLAANIGTLKGIAEKPENFEIDKRITTDDRIQSSVVVTVSWTDKPASPCVSSQSSQNSSPGSNPGGSAQGQQAASPPAGCSTPTRQSTSFALNFGQGPRTFESAGLVFSPLAQHSYSTATAGSSSNCPSTVGTVTQAGCIVDNGGAGWRILPMALATVRFADVPWSQWRILVPNCFSFGATIKSNSSSGTSLEYLTGLSWASPGQHVFLTAGAYAGEVTRLAGGLSVGPQAVAPPSTLPTSTPYHWGLGFAISYAFTSQGGDTIKTTGQSAQPSTPKTSGGSTPAAKSN